MAGEVVKAPLRAGGGVLAIIPQDIDQVWRLAGMAVAGQMAPKSLVENKKYEEAQAACAIAIMAGAELGMTPLMALRSYAVVNGRPTLWGDGIKAVVRQSGKCGYIRAGGDLTKGWCTAKRTDTDEEMTREFTWEQAKKAGLNNKKGPWQDYPDMMLERRATFRCLNDLFADVLGGIADATDIEERPGQQVVESEAPPAPVDITPAKQIEAPAAPSDEPAKVIDQPKTFDVEGYLDMLEGQLALGGDAATVQEIWDEEGAAEMLADNDEALARAKSLLRVRLAVLDDKQPDDAPPAPDDDDMFPGDR